jgi:hypothetical protein
MSPPGDAAHRVHQVMMVVPVDAHVDEAQDVREERGTKRCERLQRVRMRRLQLEHHDGDDHSDDAVAAPRIEDTAGLAGYADVRTTALNDRSKRKLERSKSKGCSSDQY